MEQAFMTLFLLLAGASAGWSSTVSIVSSVGSDIVSKPVLIGLAASVVVLAFITVKYLYRYRSAYVFLGFVAGATGALACLYFGKNNKQLIFFGVLGTLFFGISAIVMYFTINNQIAVHWKSSSVIDMDNFGISTVADLYRELHREHSRYPDTYRLYGDIDHKKKLADDDEVRSRRIVFAKGNTQTKEEWSWRMEEAEQLLNKAFDVYVQTFTRYYYYVHNKSKKVEDIIDVSKELIVDCALNLFERVNTSFSFNEFEPVLAACLIISLKNEGRDFDYEVYKDQKVTSSVDAIRMILAPNWDNFEIVKYEVKVLEAARFDVCPEVERLNHNHT